MGDWGTCSIIYSESTVARLTEVSLCFFTQILFNFPRSGFSTYLLPNIDRVAKLYPNRGCDHWGWYNESDYNESNDRKDKDNDDKCKYWRSAKDRN